MNEVFFFSHLLIVIFFILMARKIGQEGLMGLFALQLVICNLFVSKQIDLFGFSVTASDAYCVGCIFCLSILQHLYGKTAALTAINMSFFLLIFFAIASEFHLLYIPSSYDAVHSSYKVILQPIPTIISTSLIVNYVTQNLVVLLNVLLTKLKWFPHFLRLLLPIAIAQLFDTIAFTLIALNHMHNPIDIIILSYIIKIITMLALSPSFLLIKKTLNKAAPSL